MRKHARSKYGSSPLRVWRAFALCYKTLAHLFIKIHKDKLSIFFTDVAKAYEKLKGEFSLESDYNNFSLRGEMTNKGQVRILVKTGHQVCNHPDYIEWFTEGAFNNDPSVLKRVIENQI